MSVEGLAFSDVEAAPGRHGGLWGDAMRRLVRSGPGLVGLVITAFFVVVALLAPALAPHDPVQGALTDRLQGPSGSHWFGTDLLGRDEFSRILYGARVSLRVAVAAVLMGVLMGGAVGAIAGTVGGRVDAALMRLVDVLLSIPGILLAIGIVTWAGQGLWQITFAVAVTTMPLFARLLRANLLALREADFVVAARSLGASRWRVLWRHMLPNALTQVIVAATLSLATAIIEVAGLGFLGLGPPDPRTPEWGSMLTDSTLYIRSAPYLLLFPSAAIVLVAVGFNLLGDALRESLDPRLKR
jgi:peptide/nickel transport system permease protein